MTAIPVTRPIVFITCRDRLTPLLAVLRWWEATGSADRLVLVDNDST